MVERIKKKKDSSVEFINTGSTLLNLALSDKGADGGIARGRVVNFVGDGSSGKTLLALEICFNCMKRKFITVIHPKVENVRIIYDNAEGVMDFPLDDMYTGLKEFVEWEKSGTVQQMTRNFSKAAKNNTKGEMLIYVVDSLDALQPEEAVERFDESIEKNKPMDGSYSLEKQKHLSQFFPNACNMMEGKDITLIIISQIRSKIGITFGEKSYRAGGKALDFYTHQVCWLAEYDKMKKQVEGVYVIYGILTRAKVKRNKTAKPFREAEMSILFDYGIDDLFSNIDYLFGPKCKTYDYDGHKTNSKQGLIKHIESNNLELDTVSKVVEKWRRIQNSVLPNRKPK